MRPVFWVSFLLFLGHQLLQKGLGVALPMADAYLDPLLSIPILLGLTELERRTFFAQPGLPVGQAAAITVVLALVFEFGFPAWSEGFRYDPYDFVAYAAGFLIWTYDRVGYFDSSRES